jgi:hypothetical protein
MAVDNTYSTSCFLVRCVYLPAFALAMSIGFFNSTIMGVITSNRNKKIN